MIDRTGSRINSAPSAAPGRAGPDPLAALLSAAVRETTDPAVRQWCHALLRREAGVGGSDGSPVEGRES
jgi:hypothetical protein